MDMATAIGATNFHENQAVLPTFSPPLHYQHHPPQPRTALHKSIVCRFVSWEKAGDFEKDYSICLPSNCVLIPEAVWRKSLHTYSIMLRAGPCSGSVSALFFILKNTNMSDRLVDMKLDTASARTTMLEIIVEIYILRGRLSSGERGWLLPTAWQNTEAGRYHHHSAGSSLRYIPRRAVLYCPGNDERKLRKLASLDVDCAVLDCEDGVALSKKVHKCTGEALNVLCYVGCTTQYLKSNPRRRSDDGEGDKERKT
ncbi:hypothetical protein JOQ06_030135 [Pogonophryne albipinna]|uniref:HpcH/HpaI aldolase/citrate lyase domain-containing protein n=1 Tax=Pogonophryne albipinna TaxID=1090488 RepID=A0AAD6AXK0_9TELE|nr:hypothetical protein JOQ06_030135 [Pogonophryne albipinna]